MDHFTYRDGTLHCEDLPLDTIAEQVGTPVYIYSRATLLSHYRDIAAAFAELDPIICYSIKSCGNVNLVKLLAEQGSGMDIVSGGELARAQKAGADPRKIVYAGVGKTDAEIEAAITCPGPAGKTSGGIGWFNIESEAEFENIAAIAQRLGKPTRGALRINPDVADPKTHAKTTTGKKETKFGVDIERAKRFFQTYGHNEHCRLTAIHLHIGSPIYSPEPYVLAIEKALMLIDELRAEEFVIDTLDIGGGYAADYETGKSPAWPEYAQAIVPLLKGKGLKIIIEPGRTIAGNAGVLLTRVQYIKTGGSKKFVICDTGMHHLLRPALYDAFHFIWPTSVSPEMVPAQREEEPDVPGLEVSEIVGPICETGDTLAKARPIPPVQRGENLCIFTAGAYGMVMANNYNAFPRPAEVLVDGDKLTVIRRRETYDDLIGPELGLS